MPDIFIDPTVTSIGDIPDPQGPLVDWRFYLADIDSMEIIEEISYAKGKQLQLQHNRAGSFSCNLHSQEEICEEIIPKKTCIIAKRNNNILWSGPVWRREVDFPDGQLKISAVGWLEELNFRELREDYPAQSRTDFEIVEDMMEIVTTEDLTAPGHITLGTMESSVTGSPLERIVGWNRGEKIGSIIQQLSDIEAGYDFWVDPVTRELNLRAWDLYEDVSDQIIFGYGWGPENISKVGFSEDAAQMINRMTVVGTGNLAVVYEASDSIAEYGLMEGTVSLSDVGNLDILQAYAYEEVELFKKRPQIIYNLTPFPYDGSDSIPQIGDDYWLGMKVSFTAKRGILNVEDQKARIFGATIDITDQGNEVISSLPITKQG